MCAPFSCMNGGHEEGDGIDASGSGKPHICPTTPLLHKLSWAPKQLHDQIYLLFPPCLSSDMTAVIRSKILLLEVRSTIQSFVARRFNSSKSKTSPALPSFDFHDPGPPPEDMRIYPTTCPKARTILKKYHGYESFRGQQEAIIARLAEKGSRVISIMPTGGGKSLIYQIWARLFDSGLVIVVVPLLSLLRVSLRWEVEGLARFPDLRLTGMNMSRIS